MPDDELDELARMLREGAGRELRAEAAEDEELTEVQRRRHRDLAGVARAAMHHGDRVTAMVAGLHLGHPVVAVGTDYLVMDTGDGLIDVRLEAAVLSVESRAVGGSSAAPEAVTFRARLAEHEQTGAPVEVVTTDGRRIGGRIEVAAIDHLVVTDGTGLTSYVPTARVAVVFSRRPPKRG